MTGSIKAYTPNFVFIIPEFNITGWHDYLEENFRSIDALFYNLFGINNFKGQWKNSTVYNVNDVVFVGEDTSYSGRLVKVLVQHTTAGTGNFTEFFTANPSYYELFADASTAQIFSQEARDWATKIDGPVEDVLYSSKYYADIVNNLSTEIITLYNIRSDIQSVNTISAEIVNVSNIKNSVQTVASNTADITTVANISSNVTTVAGNSTDISTNAINISAINTNASNISAIQNAYSNAQSAANSKDKAQEWAISSSLVDNTDYSAKYYAAKAEEAAERAENPVLSMLTQLYPVGSIYIGVQNTCPLTTLIPNSQWTLVAGDRALYGGDGSQAGTNLTAGLPDITGSVDNVFTVNESTSNGALSKAPSANVFNVTTSGGSAHTYGTVSFNASNSSSIYGNSNTVQPPAYVVNIWQRTA